MLNGETHLVPEERTRDVDLLASDDGDLLTAQDLYPAKQNKRKKRKHDADAHAKTKRGIPIRESQTTTGEDDDDNDGYGPHRVGLNG